MNKKKTKSYWFSIPLLIVTAIFSLLYLLNLLNVTLMLFDSIYPVTFGLLLGAYGVQALIGYGLYRLIRYSIRSIKKNGRDVERDA